MPRKLNKKSNYTETSKKPLNYKEDPLEKIIKNIIGGKTRCVYRYILADNYSPESPPTIEKDKIPKGISEEQINKALALAFSKELKNQKEALKNLGETKRPTWVAEQGKTAYSSSPKFLNMQKDIVLKDLAMAYQKKIESILGASISKQEAKQYANCYYDMISKKFKNETPKERSNVVSIENYKIELQESGVKFKKIELTERKRKSIRSKTQISAKKTVYYLRESKSIGRCFDKEHAPWPSQDKEEYSNSKYCEEFYKKYKHYYERHAKNFLESSEVRIQETLKIMSGSFKNKVRKGNDVVKNLSNNKDFAEKLLSLYIEDYKQKYERIVKEYNAVSNITEKEIETLKKGLLELAKKILSSNKDDTMEYSEAETDDESYESISSSESEELDTNSKEEETFEEDTTQTKHVPFHKRRTQVNQNTETPNHRVEILTQYDSQRIDKPSGRTAHDFPVKRRFKETT